MKICKFRHCINNVIKKHFYCKSHKCKRQIDDFSHCKNNINCNIKWCGIITCLYHKYKDSVYCKEHIYWFFRCKDCKNKKEFCKIHKCYLCPNHFMCNEHYIPYIKDILEKYIIEDLSILILEFI